MRRSGCSIFDTAFMHVFTQNQQRKERSASAVTGGPGDLRRTNVKFSQFWRPVIHKSVNKRKPDEMTFHLYQEQVLFIFSKRPDPFWGTKGPLSRGYRYSFLKLKG